jgi:hypothetical protein
MDYIFATELDGQNVFRLDEKQKSSVLGQPARLSPSSMLSSQPDNIRKNQ